MVKERQIWLDNLKGTLILIVVLGHTLLFTTLRAGENNYCYRLISSIWMPLFMFTSGVALGITNKNPQDIGNWLIIIKKRIYSLLIPFVSWSIVL